MLQNSLHVDSLPHVVDSGNQPKLVAANIEHGTAAAQHARRGECLTKLHGTGKGEVVLDALRNA